MTHKENIRAILECYFTGFKEEIIESACDRILEQEPKTGHWIASDILNEDYVCSECGGASWYYDYQAHVARSKYCPNCGAKMIEPQESEKINCKTAKCENCQNHNYCDYESKKGSKE